MKHVLWRIGVAILGFFIASIVGGAGVMFAIFSPDWSKLVISQEGPDTISLFVIFGMIFVSGFVLLPAFIVIAIAEAFAIRSVLYYTLAGALIAFVIFMIFSKFDIHALQIDALLRRALEIVTGTGIAAGFTYWLIAGRSAGIGSTARAAPSASDPTRI